MENLKTINDEIASDDGFNIVEILLIDHAYMKECISTLTDKNAERTQKAFYARTFLDTLKKHCSALEKTVYDSLIEMEDFNMEILERVAENSMFKFKYDTLIPKIAKMPVLDNATEAEMKVLAELVAHHIRQEETKLFPKMKIVLDHTILNEIGFQFMILRRFTPQDLKDYPELQRKIYQPDSMDTKTPRKNIYKWSGDFVKKVNRYISSLIVPVHAMKSK